VPPPFPPPIGLRLAHAAKAVGRAFDAALAAAGGSRPTWLILIALKSGRTRNQRELARAVGIEGATLTHHLDAMEAEGLITRRRDPGNRRVQVVELTERGEAAFNRMRGAAVGFDRRLRAGIPDTEVARLGELLDRLRENVAPGDPSQSKARTDTD
jgi:MarR family transcriptional regulator, transcriptional regulator for hemolysin